MKVVVLGSSSSGNSTFVEMNNIKFLIDVGLQFNDLKEKLHEINVDPHDIDFIIITHAHIDHVRCLHSFSRVYGTKIYISSETLDEYFKKDYIKNYEFVEDIDNIMGIRLDKVPISHDKKGFGYVFECEGVSLAYIADTGIIHSKYHDKFKNKTIYLFESNHDVEMEMNGTKDPMTKIRNIGDMGHLSNEQCAMYLSHFVGDNTKIVMLIHISDHDNTHELAFNVNRKALNDNIKLYLSNKDKISEMIEL